MVPSLRVGSQRKYGNNEFMTQFWGQEDSEPIQLVEVQLLELIEIRKQDRQDQQAIFCHFSNHRSPGSVEP